ncbi:MAG: hypothetical protein MK086_01205 [Flavobacteriales bacterium]|nr:hypothetical protein [Flavobacteriales bacterium]
MKKHIVILLTALISSPFVYSQEGKLVSIDADTKQAYYTRNDVYTVEADGSFSGNIAAFYDNGKIEETGVLSKGEKVGTWIKYNPDGDKISKGSYKDGLKNGEWKVWDADGTLRVSMNYESGKRTGKWEFYDENGELLNSKQF